MSLSPPNSLPTQDPEPAAHHLTTCIGLRRPIRREGSGQTMVYLLVSFIASVSLTRLILSLSGYPQLGGGDLHISHVLWGGLLLFAAALLLLLFANRQIYKPAAVLAGIGIGLFIDEVGKFITLENDYFYPLAAPIIYIFFMLLLILVIQLRRQIRSSPRAEFNRALETLQDWAEHPLKPSELAHMLQRLKYASECPDANLAGLASSILSVVQADTRPAPEERPVWWIIKAEQWLSEPRLRLGLAFGFVIMALMAFKTPAGELLAARLPDFWAAALFGTHSGQWYGSEAAPWLYQARLALEILLSVLLLATSLLLFFKQARLGVALGFGLLIFYLATISTLLFYFEQFSTIIFVMFQYLLLAGVIDYRKRFLPDIIVNP